MAENTAISWADHTWSPWYGCTQVSMGEHGACVGCYARFLSETRQHRVVFGGPGRGEGTRDAKADSGWKEPLKWEREAAAAKRSWDFGNGMGQSWPYSPFIFPSMCDPFDNHPDLPPLLRRLFDLIRATPHLTWLLLTKRPGNIVKLFRETYDGLDPVSRERLDLSVWWPRNAAIGCTVVTQEEADRDIPKLLAAKAVLNPAFAFVSMEPLLGPVDLTALAINGDEEMDALNPCTWGDVESQWAGTSDTWEEDFEDWFGHAPGAKTGLMHPLLDWVITGGETDQGSHKARPSSPAWFRHLRDQCAAAGVAYHHKQNGEWGHCPERSAVPDHVFRVGKKAAGRMLDGVIHDARPEVR